MTYRIRLFHLAEADLAGMFDYISEQASVAVASAYVNRIADFIAGLETFPQRGTVRDDLRPGLRLVGFERRVTIAFVVEAQEVVILRVLYAGRQFDMEEGQAAPPDVPTR